MYKPHEIISHLTPALADQFFAYLQKNEKKLYVATIDTLAKQRKFRPVFIEQKPPAQRHAWMREALGRATNESISAHLLQIWFVSGHSNLLCDFLDALGIPHDDNGTIEKTPPAPEKSALKAAIDSLVQKHDPALLAVYMHAFQALDDSGGWPSLEELLAEDERLKL
jgi:hypothetical protein